MAGYTRQSTYTDGDVINAADSNDEFDQLVSVFSNTIGHKHDGTAAEGPVIALIGDPGVATPINKVVVDDSNNRVGVFVDVSSVSVEQVRFIDGGIVPVTDNDIDLGASGAEFKDLYIDGTAYIDTASIDAVSTTGNVTVGGTLGVTGATTLSSTLDVTGNGTVGGTFDATGNSTIGGTLGVTGATTLSSTLGVTGNSTIGGTLGVTGATTLSSTANITGNTTVGGTLGVTGNTTLTADLTVNGNTTLGNAATDTVTVNADVASDLIPSADDTHDLGAVGAEWKDLFIDGTANVDTLVIGSSTGVTSVDTDLSSVSASDDTLASAKAIKSYVDSQVTAQDLDFQGDTGGALSIDLDSEVLDIAGGTGIDTSGAGNTLTVAIDSTVATLSGTQTLTNKTIDSASNTLTVDLSEATVTGTTAEFNTALSDDSFATLTNTVTLTNKTVNLSSNTLTGTTAQFNTALSDDSFATLTNTVTLTNKTIDSANNTLTVDLSEATVTGTTAEFNTALSDGSFATLAGTETLTNKTLTSPTIDLSTVTSAGDLAVADGGTGASNASDARDNLGLTIGTNVQAYDAGLASIAGLTTSANQLIYTTGSDTYNVSTITAFGRSLVDDADAATARTTLGLGTAATADSTDFDPAGTAVALAIALG